MSSNRLASAGDVVAIWDGIGYTPVHTFSPTIGSRKVISSTWNIDGSCLASCVDGSDKLLMTSIRPTAITTVEMDTGLGVKPVRLLYPRTTLKLVMVGATDKVGFSSPLPLLSSFAWSGGTCHDLLSLSG